MINRLGRKKCILISVLAIIIVQVVLFIKREDLVWLCISRLIMGFFCPIDLLTRVIIESSMIIFYRFVP
jgi:predicted MFS family arabinose efflux permease